jgi:hypothetical protein
MTDPRKEQRRHDEPDGLELDAETGGEDIRRPQAEGESFLAGPSRCGRLVTLAASDEEARGMTDPKEDQEDRKELELDAETVRDLEPTDDDADEVQGGRAAMCSGGCPTASDCP